MGDTVAVNAGLRGRRVRLGRSIEMYDKNSKIDEDFFAQQSFKYV